MELMMLNNMKEGAERLREEYIEEPVKRASMFAVKLDDEEASADITFRNSMIMMAVSMAALAVSTFFFK
jgi:hypothetical protein